MSSLVKFRKGMELDNFLLNMVAIRPEAIGRFEGLAEIVDEGGCIIVRDIPLAADEMGGGYEPKEEPCEVPDHPYVPAVPDVTWERSRELESQMPPIFPEDIMIVSYPRSGNTWVRFLFANLMADREEPLDFSEMEELVPAPYTVDGWDRIRSMPPGRLIKSYMPYDKRYKQVIYIVRDGRDAMVSYYHYHCPRNFEATFLEFLQKDLWPGPWGRHVQSWLDNADEPRLLLVRYEDLQADPAKQLRRMAEFAGLSTDEQKISRAVGNSTLETLGKIEGEKGHPQIKSPGFKFFRKGVSDCWKEYFGPVHKELFKESANDVLLRLGYIDGPDW